jgi:hypothetical protein
MRTKKIGWIAFRRVGSFRKKMAMTSPPEVTAVQRKEVGMKSTRANETSTLLYQAKQFHEEIGNKEEVGKDERPHCNSFCTYLDLSCFFDPVYA